MTTKAPFLRPPMYAFRFELAFDPEPFKRPKGETVGSFAECTGLEATMEPKVIKAGGNNYGGKQLAGPVTFATVVLRRGISRGGQLFKWFHRVASGDYGHRCGVTITVFPPDGDSEPLLWKLSRAMPVKFKAADLNARATEVGIEELHLVHEGLTLELGKGGGK
ncbi:phage tail protein [Polyangium jinanense]|nr:phage tail protein [Polyangium jinanense]